MSAHLKHDCLPTPLGDGDAVDGRLPLVVFPWAPSTDSSALRERLSACAERYLPRTGSILFRGFGVRDEASFRAFVTSFARPGHALRLSSSVYPGDCAPDSSAARRLRSHWQRSLHHAGQTHAGRPSRLWFGCTQAAGAGARMLIADAREVYRRVPARIRRDWRERGLLVLRNYTAAGDASWSRAFGSSDWCEVEARCRALAIEWEWKKDGRLRLSKVCSPVAHHPLSHELVWFNDAHIFHGGASELPQAEPVKRVAGEDLARSVCYADGAALLPGDIAEVRAAYASAQLSVSWEAGDVLMLDNLLSAHGDECFGELSLATAVELPEPCILGADPLEP
jgi:alpha-ketoglutarate-dependent taurine dioxygenase